MTIADLISPDLTDSAVRGALVTQSRRGLAEHGVASIPAFLTDATVAASCAEALVLEASSHHQDIYGTPYLGLPDETFPAGHPRRAEVRSALSSIAYDLFPATSLLRRLYESRELLQLVSDMLERSPLHRYADPFGALNVAVMRDGDELGWHFDQTDFVVSIALQSAIDGGDFESADRLRSDCDENYEGVTAVLDSTSPNITSVPMTPGTLMVFEGRNSLHRVTTIQGNRPRLVALLAYDTKADTDSSELLKLVRYGRLP